MSPAMKNFQETLTLPIATQNVTAFRLIPVTRAEKVTAISIAFYTLPVVSGGTDTIQVDYLSSSGASPINIVAASSTLSGMTAKAVLAYPAGGHEPCDDDCGRCRPLITRATSNNTVGTADVGGMMTIRIQPIEDTTIVD